MSPILVRPVREQFEHDRVIRVLQAKYKRKYEVAINPGAEQNASVEVGAIAMYPDLLLFSQERGRRLQATIEVETGESINTLEAMAEWAPLSRLRAAFFLYVPQHTIDTVRRLCAEHDVTAAEIWTYHLALDQVRFTMVHRIPELAAAMANSRTPPRTEKAPVKSAKTVKKSAPAKSIKSAKPAAAKSAKAAKSAAAAKSAKSAAAKSAAAKSAAAKKAAKRR